MNPVCALSDLADRTPLAAEVDDTPVVLVRDGDTVHALHDVCTHAELSLSEGEVEGRGDRLGITCWLHGSRFNLRTGAPDSPPATDPVDVYAVTVTDGAVHVDVTRPINH